jgi:hypothetical protein
MISRALSHPRRLRVASSEAPTCAVAFLRWLRFLNFGV